MNNHDAIAERIIEVIKDSQDIINNEFNEIDYPTVTILYAMDVFIREMYRAKPQFKQWVEVLREADEEIRDTSCIIMSKDEKTDTL